MRILGDIYIGEVVLSLIAIHSIFQKKNHVTNRHMRLLQAFSIIWIISNLVASFNSSKELKWILIGVFTPLITIACLSTCFRFMNLSNDILVKSILFFAVGRLIGALLNPLPYTDAYPWKFGYGENVILLFLATCFIINRSIVTFFGTFILSAISFFNHARTLAFLTLAVGISLIPGHKKSRSKQIIILLAIFMPLCYWIYINLGLSGYLGSNEISRAQLLTSTNLGPLAARKEVIFSFNAFTKSPLLGYGFNPQVDPHIVISGYQFWADHGYPIRDFDPSVLPLHSFLWSALIQGGFFASSFWIACLLISFFAVYKTLEFGRTSRVLVIYFSTAMIDRILFSPYGAYERLNVSIFMASLLIFLTKIERKQNADN